MSETNEASVQSVVHTPGPWTVANNGKSVLAGSVKINQQAGPCAASAGVQIAIDRELQANAKLIAAAVDLLEALQEVVEDGLKTNTTEWIKKANAAIAKATGEQV